MFKLRSTGVISPNLVLSVSFFLIFLVSLVLLAIPALAATPAEEGQAIFEQRCQGCHTIGGGRGVGPDLKDVTAARDRDWLIRFITTPDRLISQQDPIAVKILQDYGLPMPNLGITANEAEAILAYFDSQSSSPGSVATPGQPAPAIIGDPANGRRLFTGETSLVNNGPACLSCHNIKGIGIIGGGTTGKDLTSVYSAAGENVIRTLLKNVPYPLMREVFTAKPLTDGEIADIVAFLKGNGEAQPTSYQNESLFLIIGVVGAVVIIGLFQLLWRGRLSGVRRSLVKGGSR